jgi:hypothetical protein
MFFSLEVLPALKGDCLLLYHGEEKPRLIVIDGGPSRVYEPRLQPRLDEIREATKPEGEPLPVDIVMISHVDDDHIKGILDMTRELRQLKQSKAQLPFAVATLWHNSFDKILKTDPAQLKAPVKHGAAALAGLQSPSNPPPGLEKVMASIPQGHKLREDAKFLGWSINRHVGEELVMATDEPKVIRLDSGLAFTVLGPMQKELTELQRKHDKWVEAQEKKDTKAEAALAAYMDRSVPNLSSLVLLAEFGGKSILLTGDARGDKILKALELTRRVKKNGSIHVNVLKVQHHGSIHNMNTDFVKRVTADHYVFSGDGEHGNPDRETLEMLLDARPDAAFTVHLTYSVEEIDKARKADWEEAQEKNRAEGEEVTPWNAKKHALASLFESRGFPDAKRKLEIVSAKPHLIELLKPVTFKKS